MTTTLATSTVYALSTVFTPPASCLSDIYNLTTTSASSPWNYLQLGPTTTSDGDCYPPKFTPGTSVYYSPGTCPSGYTVACSSIVNINTVSETRATCCPSQYTCQDESAAGWPWYPTELCTYGATETGTFYVTAPTTTATYIGTPKFNAYGISIRYQSTDTATSTTTTSSSSTSSSSSSEQTSQTLTSTPTSTTSADTGLSTGAKAGIGIGAAVGGILAIAGIAFLSIYYRRRRRQIVPEMCGVTTLPNPNIYPQGELEDTQRSTYRFHELDSKTPAAELSGESRFI